MVGDDSNRFGRRAFLTKAGAVGTLGVAGTNVVAGERKVEVPIVKRGDKVLKTKLVPHEWWQHVKRTRRVNEQLSENVKSASGTSEVRTVPSSETIRGRNKLKVQVGVEWEQEPGMQLPNTIEDVKVERTPPIHFEETCNNHQNYSIVPGGVPMGNSNGTGTSGCQVVHNSEYRMITAAHIWGCSGQANSNVDQYNQHFGQTTNAFDESLDYMIVEENSSSCSIGGAIEYNGTHYDVGGRAENYEVLMEDNTTVYKTGIHSGYTTGTIAGTSQTVTAGCSNYNGLLYTNNQAGGDSGTAAFIQETWNGKTWAVITGLANVGGGNSSTIICHGDYIDEYPYTAGPTSEDIHNDSGAIFSGGTSP